MRLRDFPHLRRYSVKQFDGRDLELSNLRLDVETGRCLSGSPGADYASLPVGLFEEVIVLPVVQLELIDFETSQR